MKINDHSDLSGIPAPGTKGASGVDSHGRTEGSREADRSGSDRAELSGLAGKIAHASAIDAKQRAERVEHLRVEVAQGRYRPDAAEISKGIVNEALSNAASTGGTGVK
jgi:flagellar biosynthesis anti-sigma factor FlgM